MSHLVQECSPAEAARIIAALGDDPRGARERMLHGHVQATCRERDGSVAWEIDQPNLITDLYRRRLADQVIHQAYVMTSPSTEAPDQLRSSVLDDGNASSSQASAIITSTYDAVTLTRAFTATFSTPAANRQIGVIGLGTGRLAHLGPYGFYAYTLITPVKTQTTTQTLEVVYRVTLTPIY